MNQRVEIPVPVTISWLFLVIRDSHGLAVFDCNNRWVI